MSPALWAASEALGRSSAKRCARGMAQLARDTGLSREALYRALSEDGNPTLATLLKVGKALGIRLTVAPV